jgi:hypothetical protein
MAEKLAKNKPLFILLSCSSVACLVGSFGYPLQQVEIYKQLESGSFGNQYIRTFIVSESDQDYPYGFDLHKAKKYAQIYQDAKWQKIILLLLAGSSAIAAIGMGNDICLHSEIDDEVLAVKSQGKKELILESVKHRLAMASKSQRLLFLDEMKELMAEFGSAEEEIQEADEINALYEAPSKPVAEEEGNCTPATPETPLVDFRGHFPEHMDASVWGLIQPLLCQGVVDEDIARGSLSCPLEVGIAYIAHLRQKHQSDL